MPAVTAPDESMTLTAHLAGANNPLHWINRISTNGIADGAVTVPSAPGFALTNIGKLTTRYVRLNPQLSAGSCLFNIRVQLLRR